MRIPQYGAPLLLICLGFTGCKGNRTPESRFEHQGDNGAYDLPKNNSVAPATAQQTSTPAPNNQSTPLPLPSPTITPPVSADCNVANAMAIVIFDCAEREIEALKAYLNTNLSQNLKDSSELLSDTKWDILTVHDMLRESQSPYTKSTLKNTVPYLKQQIVSVGIAANKSPLYNNVLAKATMIANLVQRVNDVLETY